MRTPLELTAKSITQSIPGDLEKAIIVGGGAKNNPLINRIKFYLSKMNDPKLEYLAKNQLKARQIEVLGFAILAKNCIDSIKTEMASITGATEAIICGAIYKQISNRSY